MQDSGNQQVYQQRYETYRHLDGLRWRMFQIAVTAGSLVIAFGKSDSDGPSWWVLAVVGLMLIAFGSVMERIRHGISRNAEILAQAANAIGDGGVPSASCWWKAVSFWIAATIIVFGLLCLVLAYFCF